MISSTNQYRVVSFSVQQTKSGNQMAKVQLKDYQTGIILNCVIWQEKLDIIDKKVFKVGNIISVLEYEHNEKYNSYSLNNVKLIEEAKLGLNKQEIETLFNEIINVVDCFSDKNLSMQIKKLISENEPQFKIAPAAENIHHNYQGGLIQHIWECINIAKANFPVINAKVDIELVLAGCIMHDFAKTFEYILDPETFLISRNKEFQAIWINHIHWGFNWANQNGFPKLAHIIASHHGTKEWNALTEPQTPEANLVHSIDLISSRLGKISITDLEFTPTSF